MTSEEGNKGGHRDRAAADVNSLAAAASTYYRTGRLAEAEAAYRAILAGQPDDVAAMQNLGAVAAALGRYRDAIALFDQAIALKPRYVPAHYNRALALLSVDRRRDAIEGLSRVCVLQPDHYDAHRALGFLWLADGDRGRALDHFARTYELRRGDDRSNLAEKSLTHATRDKLLHDAGQFRFLAAGARDGQRFGALARTYEDIAKDFPEHARELSGRELERIGDDYNGPVHQRAAPEISGGTLETRRNLESLFETFRASGAGATYFDTLLTPDALKRLRAFLLESTIWHDFSHIGGFVASYLEDGLACPLVLQIADEIRKTFPGLLAGHPLSQAWAFKGLKSSSAIDVHADDGVITVNFWVTPDAANLKPDRGGLVVSLTPPPDDWALSGYESDQRRIVSFLEQTPGNRLIVPYKENRAVVFRSHLFHWSDRTEFAPGYENHRINMTFLYGRHGTPPLRQDGRISAGPSGKD